MKNFVFISLGPNCHTAGILKKLGYKKESYPLDWMLTNLKIINYLILNDFSEFLDRNNYYKKDNNISLIDKNIEYLNKMFVHRDPVDNESDFLYTIRCVNRFNNLKQDNRCKLFFHTIYNNEYNEKRKEIEELNVLLKKKCKNYKLVIINYIKTDDVNINNLYKVEFQEIIFIRIYIMYNQTIDYALDKSIFEFYAINNPIEEIIKKLC